jgi:hypothetical protein
MRHIVIAFLAPFALVLVGLPLAIQYWNGGPNSIAEVVAQAEKRGLYCTVVPYNDPDCRRVIISAMPLDEDEAASVNLSLPHTGTASCYVNWECARIHHNPAHSLFWGDMFVHGDPAVINLLTGSKLGGQ